MSTKDYYQLEFYFKIINGRRHNICVKKKPDYGNNSQLLFLQYLDINDCQGFIDDLEGCIDSQHSVDEGFFSDSVDDRDIRYDYPNVVINNILTIPMLDMKGLLQEWLAFIHS